MDQIIEETRRANLRALELTVQRLHGLDQLASSISEDDSASPEIVVAMASDLSNTAAESPAIPTASRPATAAPPHASPKRLPEQLSPESDGESLLGSPETKSRGASESTLAADDTAASLTPAEVNEPTDKISQSSSALAADLDQLEIAIRALEQYAPTASAGAETSPPAPHDSLPKSPETDSASTEPDSPTHTVADQPIPADTPTSELHWQNTDTQNLPSVGSDAALSAWDLTLSPLGTFKPEDSETTQDAPAGSQTVEDETVAQEPEDLPSTALEQSPDTSQSRDIDSESPLDTVRPRASVDLDTEIDEINAPAKPHEKLNPIQNDLPTELASQTHAPFQTPFSTEFTPLTSPTTSRWKAAEPARPKMVFERSGNSKSLDIAKNLLESVSVRRGRNLLFVAPDQTLDYQVPLEQVAIDLTYLLERSGRLVAIKSTQESRVSLRRDPHTAPRTRRRFKTSTDVSDWQLHSEIMSIAAGQTGAKAVEDQFLALNGDDDSNDDRLVIWLANQSQLKPLAFLAAACDATVVLVNLNESQLDDCRFVVNELRDHGARLIGTVVLNESGS